MASTQLGKHIGIIMDGNRRWAKSRGLPTLEGHRRGYEKMQEVMEWAREADISFVTVYAFSTENWGRTPEEVSYLLDLFKETLTVGLAKFKDQKVRVRCIGDRARFSEGLQTLMRKAEAETASFGGPTLVLALSYGGRTEIIEGVRRAITEGVSTVTEQTFPSLLWSAGIPDPDIIIRTGGEKRLSGFLTWQSVYSELFFVDTFWPDFSKSEFQAILDEFGRRERRKGK